MDVTNDRSLLAALTGTNKLGRIIINLDIDKSLWPELSLFYNLCEDNKLLKFRRNAKISNQTDCNTTDHKTHFQFELNVIKGESKFVIKRRFILFV